MAVFGTIFIASPSVALEQNAWSPNSNPTLSFAKKSEGSSFSGCKRQLIKISGSYNPLTNITSQEACIYTTPYGSFSPFSEYIRFGESGSYRTLENVSVVGVPNSNKLLVRFPGTSRTAIYDDARIALTPYTINNTYTLRLSGGATYWRDSYRNTYLQAGYIGFSDNGKWAVAEVSGGLMKIDMDTGARKNVGSSYNSGFLNGVNAAYQVRISEDGRYIAAGNGVTGEVRVVDSATCVSSKLEDPVGTTADCEKMLLRDKVKAFDPLVRSVYVTGFRSVGREIFVTGRYADGTIKYYIASASQGIKSDYVALGDSYSSGEGDAEDEQYLPGTNGTVEHPTEKCHNSRRSYPYLMKNVSNGIFYSFACSGAQTEDILGQQKKREIAYYIGNFNQLSGLDKTQLENVKDAAISSNTLGRAPQYKFIEKFQPKSISITIGGNDVGFGSMLSGCVTKGIDNTTCSWATTDKAAKGREIQAVYSKLRSTYSKLKQSSGNSTLYVLSYPQFISTSNKCELNVQLNSVEREFVRKSVTYINDVIEQAAKAEGAVYIDIENSLQGYELCSGAKDKAVNGITLGDDMGVGVSVFGKELFLIGNESFHPNQYGHSLIAAYIKSNYGTLPDLQGTSCLEDCSSFVAPPVPAYYGATPATPIATKQDFIMDTIGDSVNWFERSQRLRVKLWTGERNAITKLQLHSEPVDLGSVKSDENGFIDTVVTIPASTSFGAHVVHAYATVNGENTDYYQPIYVVASKDDIDGDGVLNSEDSCEFIEPSGVDEDRDGIDDSCDNVMNETAVNGTGTTVAPNSSVGEVVSITPVSNSLAVSAVLGDEMLAAEVLVGNKLSDSPYETLATVRTIASEALIEWGITDSRIRAQAVDIGWVGIQAAAVILPLGAGAAIWRKKMKSAV